MKTCFVDHYFGAAQNALYRGLENCAWDSVTIARLYAGPTALVDVLFENAKSIARIFENFLNAAMNLAGSYLYKECNVKEAILYAQSGLGGIYCLPLLPLMTVVKLFYQVVMNVYDPLNAQSISFGPSLGDFDMKTVTFKSAYPVKLKVRPSSDPID